MANSRRIICLKLGSQTICLAEFIAPRQGGLVLRNYAFREVLIDPADESLDQGELAALQELVSVFHTRNCNVNYASQPADYRLRACFKARLVFPVKLWALLRTGTTDAG